MRRESVDVAPKTCGPSLRALGPPCRVRLNRLEVFIWRAGKVCISEQFFHGKADCGHALQSLGMNFGRSQVESRVYGHEFAVDLLAAWILSQANARGRGGPVAGMSQQAGQFHP